MPYCTNCGEKLVDGANFCYSCGQPTARSQGGASEQRKTVYDGELHKCPNCGELLDAFVTECQACGYELRGAKASSRVRELESTLARNYSREQKADIIRSFYIPNTKEDIYEFFILAVSNINTGGYDAEAWFAKLEQAYQKAKISFKDDPALEDLCRLYTEAKKQMGVKRIVGSNLLWRLIIGGIGLLMLIVGFIIGPAFLEGNSFYLCIAVGSIGAAIFLGAVVPWGKLMEISNQSRGEFFSSLNDALRMTKKDGSNKNK